jgi:hypothetical protein
MLSAVSTPWAARRGFARVTVVAVSTLVALAPADACSANIKATPSSFSSAVSSADSGDTIVLESGSYGEFTGASAPGAMTIRAAPGAVAAMDIRLRGESGLTFDGLAIGNIELSGSTHDIIVRNSQITGQTVLRTGELANSNILFDGNVHDAWNKCSGCGEGRVFLPQKTSQPSGITIQNSRFGPGGDSDGIQNGSNGTRILNNEFLGIKQIAGGAAHADAIQLYGSSNTVIRGNWFHDVSVGVMAPDGADHEVIEDNVIQSTSPYAIQLGSDSGSVIRHNTFPDGRCEFNKRCGLISLGAKSGQPASQGTVIKDNILAEISFQGTVLQEEDYNLFAVRVGRGAHDTRGLPTYVGGAAPASYAGFALAAGSNGKGTASDGMDRGARIGAGAGGPPSGGSAPSGGSKKTLRPRMRLLSGKRAIRRSGRLRLRVRARQAGPLTITAAIRPRSRPRARPIRLGAKTVRFANAGRRTVALRLSRDARRRLGRWRTPKLVVRAFSDSQRQRPTGRFRFRIER